MSEFFGDVVMYEEMLCCGVVLVCCVGGVECDGVCCQIEVGVVYDDYGVVVVQFEQ